MTDADDRYHIQVLSRAVRVLYSFSARRPSQTLDGLSERLDINKTTLLRIVRTLESEQLLLRSGDHYRLGPRVLGLGNAFLSTVSVHEIAREPMRDLAERSGQTVSLAILDDFHVVYIGIEQAQREVGIQGEIGGRHPAHATGLGKVLLAALDDEALEARVAGRELSRLTHRTIVDPERLVARVRQVRDEGIAVDDEERGIGIRCIAAPIRDHRGDTVAAVSVAGPIFHMTDDALERIRGQLLETAEEISRLHGYDEAVVAHG